MWHLAEGAETCRVLALWALQMKHTRFSRKKNASTVAVAILGLPATKGLGFIGENPMQSPREGFLSTSKRGRRGFRPSEILPLRLSSLLLKLERGV